MALSKWLSKCPKINLTALPWLNSSSATKTALQSLIGKLAFVSACISLGRIFTQCMLNELRLLTHKQQQFHPSPEMHADLEWWSLFLASYNGVSLIHSELQINNPYDSAQMPPSMESAGFMMGDSFMPPTLISSLNSHCTSTPLKSLQPLSASNCGFLFYLVSAS